MEQAIADLAKMLKVFRLRTGKLRGKEILCVTAEIDEGGHCDLQVFLKGANGGEVCNHFCHKVEEMIAILRGEQTAMWLLPDEMPPSEDPSRAERMLNPDLDGDDDDE